MAAGGMAPKVLGPRDVPLLENHSEGGDNTRQGRTNEERERRRMECGFIPFLFFFPCLFELILYFFFFLKFL